MRLLIFNESPDANPDSCPSAPSLSVPLPTESRPTASTPWIVFVTRKHQQHKAQATGADL